MQHNEVSYFDCPPIPYKYPQSHLWFLNPTSGLGPSPQALHPPDLEVTMFYNSRTPSPIRHIINPPPDGGFTVHTVTDEASETTAWRDVRPELAAHQDASATTGNPQIIDSPDPNAAMACFSSALHVVQPQPIYGQPCFLLEGSTLTDSTSSDSFAGGCQCRNTGDKVRASAGQAAPSDGGTSPAVGRYPGAPVTPKRPERKSYHDRATRIIEAASKLDAKSQASLFICMIRAQTVGDIKNRPKSHTSPLLDDALNTLGVNLPDLLYKVALDHQRGTHAAIDPSLQSRFQNYRQYILDLEWTLGSEHQEMVALQEQFSVLIAHRVPHSSDIPVEADADASSETDDMEWS